MLKKTAILFCALTLATAAEASAQTLNVAKQGDKAVLFNFNGLSALNLTAYQGGLGGKYFIEDNLAVRGMLLFGMNNQTTGGTPEITNDNMTFGISAGIEDHLPLTSQISPYVGGVLSFQTTAGTTNSGIGISKTTTTVFGLGAVGGIEYFFNQNLSLSAEYQFGFNSTNSTSSGASNQSDFTLGFQTVGLTLAAYF